MDEGQDPEGGGGGGGYLLEGTGLEIIPSIHILARWTGECLPSHHNYVILQRVCQVISVAEKEICLKNYIMFRVFFFFFPLMHHTAM